MQPAVASYNYNPFLANQPAQLKVEGDRFVRSLITQTDIDRALADGRFSDAERTIYDVYGKATPGAHRELLKVVRKIAATSPVDKIDIAAGMAGNMYVEACSVKGHESSDLSYFAQDALKSVASAYERIKEFAKAYNILLKLNSRSDGDKQKLKSHWSAYIETECPVERKEHERELMKFWG